MAMPVRHLFVVMAEMSEPAHEVAIVGQSEALTAGDYTEAAQRLQGAARGLAALAEAAVVIAGPIDGDLSGRPDQTP